MPPENISSDTCPWVCTNDIFYHNKAFMLFTIDQNDTIVCTNTTAQNITGYADAVTELLGKKIHDIFAIQSTTEGEKTTFHTKSGATGIAKVIATYPGTQHESTTLLLQDITTEERKHAILHNILQSTDKHHTFLRLDARWWFSLYGNNTQLLGYDTNEALTIQNLIPTKEEIESDEKWWSYYKSLQEKILTKSDIITKAAKYRNGDKNTIGKVEKVFFKKATGEILVCNVDRIGIDEESNDIVRIHNITEFEESKMKVQNLMNTVTDMYHRMFKVIGHDLKSPFNGLKGFFQIKPEKWKDIWNTMCEQAVVQEVDFSSKEAKSFLKNINSNNEIATKIIEMLEEMESRDEMQASSVNAAYELLQKLLEWTRIQTNTVAVHIQKHRPYDVVCELAPILENTVNKEKNIQFTRDVPETLSPVYADGDAVFTILHNLCMNAHKFSTPGGVVSISARETDEKKHVQFTVQDTGVGIEPENLSTMFDVVQNPSTPWTHNEKGSGLWIAMITERVKKINWRIRAESTLRVWSTFHFTIPVYDNQDGKNGWDEEK